MTPRAGSRLAIRDALRPALREAIIGGFEAFHPTAIAYAATVGLDRALTLKLSRHLIDLDDAGILPVQLTLGRSAWKARNGSSWRAVIGNNATITGSVTDAAEGQQFPGTANNYARFANPIQNPALSELGMVVVGRALTGTTTQYMLSAYSTANSRGPSLSLNASPQQGTNANDLYWDIADTATTGTLGGSSSQKNINSGGMMAFGGSFEASQTPRNYSGAWNVQTSASVIATLWNNGATWAIGGRPDFATPITGAVSYALVSSNAMTPDRYAALYSSALKHGIIQTEATSVLVGMGDSLMQGAMPSANNDNTLTHQLTYTATGGAWQNACTAQNSGIGGSTITSFEGVQRTAALRWARADGFANRWVVHFGAHNDTGYQSSDEATRNALMERYIAVLNELKSLGAKIAVVSPLDGANGNPTQLAASAAYRTRLAVRCAEEGFTYVNLHVDPDFSVASRNTSYFLPLPDVIHLSAAGYTRATQLFVAAIPSPSFAP